MGPARVTLHERPTTAARFPFAASRNSGVGLEQSLHAIEHYTRIKNVNVKLD